MDFCTILKKLREDMGLTQKELAEKLQCSEKTISGYERGERTPKQKKLEEIADFFGVSTDYLLGRKTQLSRDMQKIEQALSKMPEKEQEKLMKILEISFTDFFGDDLD